jgi:hypothetical protein
MQSFRITTVLVAVLLGTGLSFAQTSLLASQGQTIAFSGADTTITGDLAPGLLLGERFGGNSGPNSGVIDDAGRVLFRAQIVDAAGVQFTGTQAYLSRGYFLGDSRGNLVKVLRGGDPEPSGTIPGATIQTGTGAITLTSTPRIASNGLIMFGTTFWDVVGGTVVNGNDTAIYVGTPGNWQILMREGSLAPGCGGATISSDFSGLSHALSSINNAGQCVFQSNVAGTGVVAANNIAWFAGTVGNVQLMLRKGDLGAGGEQVSGIGFSVQMNGSGQALTDITYLVGSGTTPVTNLTDKAIWLYTPGFGNTELVRESSPSPIAGTFYGSPSLSGNSVLNGAGQALVGVDLTGAVTAGVDNYALFLLSPSSSSVVARRGDAAPGIPGANFNTPSTFTMCVNDAGTVAFNSTLIQGGVITAANDSGLWTGTPGNLTLVAREGDVAPGSGGQTFGAFSANVYLNAAGQVLFQNALSGGLNVQSVYSWDPVLGLQPVVFPNDQVEVQPGVFRTLTSIGTAPVSNGQSRALNFASDGTVTFRPSFTDNSFGVVTIRTGSLTGRPSKISEATGGTHKLYLQAGSAHAGELYAIAGSGSGTNPGTPIGLFIVPLNIDAYTDFTLANANVGPYVNTLGNLDTAGRAVAQIVIPALPGFAGVVVHHAYGVLDAFNNLVFASEAARLEITP